MRRTVGKDRRIGRDVIAAGEVMHHSGIDDAKEIFVDLLFRGVVMCFPAQLIVDIIDRLRQIDAADLIVVQQCQHMFQI